MASDRGADSDTLGGYSVDGAVLRERLVRWVLWTGFVLIGTLFASNAYAEQKARIALLIGNQGYPANVGPLDNPHNDIALLSEALGRLGFQVTIVQDAGLAETHKQLNAYLRKLRAGGQGTVGFFYYSGHGASDGTTNYIIPVDVTSTDTTELWDQSLRLSEITRKLKAEAGNATHFIVFDACRNTLKLSAPGSRSSLLQAKGYVPVRQEPGMLISYATAEGELATDEGKGAGLYARILSEEIVRPGTEAVTMFRTVQIRVKQAIGQDPWLAFPSLPPVYFAGETAPKTIDPSTQLQAEAERRWIASNLDRTSDRQKLEEFAHAHEGAPYWALRARQKVAVLDAEAAVRRARTAEEALRNAEQQKNRLAKETEAHRAAQQAQIAAADDKAWSEVRQLHTVDAYKRYLAEFSGGSHRDEALDAIRVLEREFGLWDALKTRREFEPLISFKDSATSRTLIDKATKRLRDLQGEEDTAWEIAIQSRSLAGFNTFLLGWPDGPHGKDARKRVRDLTEIAALWQNLKNSDSESELDAFVSQHGWSEFGAEAAQRLVALRKEKGKKSDRASSIRALKATELRDELSKGTLNFQFSGTTIRIDRNGNPAYRKALGSKYMASLLPEKVLQETQFVAKSDHGAARGGIEGLAAIVVSQVDQTGSLFLLQMHGNERSGKDINDGDRHYMTLHMLRTKHGLVCVGTKWQSLSVTRDPERYTENCTLSK